MLHRTVRRKADQTIALAIEPMSEADIGQAHELSVGVGWPHRPEDWRVVLSLGTGFVARDAIGRAVGSAMWWPFGDHFATVGMVITSPRLQAQGAGRQLMKLIFDEAGQRDLRLNSTRAGYRLYRSLGFEPIGRIFQHQGRARMAPGHDSSPPAGDGPRAATADDLPALTRLDALAYGADRARVLAALLDLSDGTVVERDGEIVGFALCRPFGRGHVVGPIVAKDDAMAIMLTRPHVAAHEGAFLRVDTAQEQGLFGGYLEACGLTIFDTVTTMILGQNHAARGAVRTFGLVNQALG